MKPIHKVFLVIATLVLAFILWSVFFNNGGVLQTGYNAVSTSVNNTWQKVTGGTQKILPTWAETNVDSEGKDLNEANSDF